MTLKNISYRIKVPASFVLAIMLTGAVVTTVLIWRAYDDLRADLFRNGKELGEVLSHSLPEMIKHDDLWLAYQTLGTGRDALARENRLFIVLDADRNVFVANRPAEIPVLSRLAAHDPELARLDQEIATRASLAAWSYDHGGDDRIYVVRPLVDDGVSIGTLIIGYPRALLWPRLWDIYKRVSLSSLAVIAILVPLGWYLGKRMVEPLTRLDKYMNQVAKGSLDPDDIENQLTEGTDEIAQLGGQFRNMIQDLEEKRRLEREAIYAERLSSLGQLAAGVAHEINNPLGGMLNAINTYRKHGSRDEVALQTLSLLERGLNHIRETVSALLVEARGHAHPLTHQDLEDVRTLLQPDIRRRGIRLLWNNNLASRIALPSTSIRQVLMNLSLNAVNAAHDGGHVGCDIHADHFYLMIRVTNDGDRIDDEKFGSLFEPFVHHSSRGTGLGLWVTYQIVQQLNGDIDVQSDETNTRFTVRLPLRQAA